jgi:hypothetical protein
VIGAPDRRVLVRRALELDHGQRQAIYKDHDVRPAVVLALDHGELVDRQPVVGGRVGIIDELHAVARDRAVGPLVLDLDAVAQHAVEGAVASPGASSGP